MVLSENFFREKRLTFSEVQPPTEAPYREIQVTGNEGSQHVRNAKGERERQREREKEREVFVCVRERQ